MDALSPAQQRLPGQLGLALLVGMVNGVHRVAMPLYASALGAAAWQVGLVGGFGYSGLLLLAMPMGAWIDRHGGRPLFTVGAAVAAVLFVLLPVWPSAWAALAGALLLGLALPFRVVPIHTEFLALLPRLSPAMAGWNRAAQTLGMFLLGPALAAALIAAQGFGLVFRLAAAGMLVALWLGRRVLGADGHTPGPLAHAPLGERLRAQAALLRGHADLRHNLLVEFLTQLAVAYFVVFGLVLATRVHGMPVQAAAGLVTLQGAVFVAVSLAGGVLLARCGHEARYLLAFAMLLAHCLTYGLAWGPRGLWLGAVWMGLGAGVQALASVTRFAELMARHGRGRVGGLSSLGAPAGGLVGAVGGGLLSQRLGPAAGFQLLAAVYAVLCVWQGWRWRRARMAVPTPRGDPLGPAGGQ